jgi:hypothetical protein
MKSVHTVAWAVNRTKTDESRKRTRYYYLEGFVISASQYYAYVYRAFLKMAGLR